MLKQTEENIFCYIVIVFCIHFVIPKTKNIHGFGKKIHSNHQTAFVRLSRPDRLISTVAIGPVIHHPIEAVQCKTLFIGPYDQISMKMCSWNVLFCPHVLTWWCSEVIRGTFRFFKTNSGLRKDKILSEIG